MEIRRAGRVNNFGMRRAWGVEYFKISEGKGGLGW